MIPEVYERLSAIMADLAPRPRAVLEVGALVGSGNLMASKALRDVPLKLGVNIAETGVYDGVPVIAADGARLPFRDASFDLVVSSSTLEHAWNFWQLCDDMRRVLRPGGVLLLAVPGYDATPVGNRLRRLAFRLRLPDLLRRGTITMRVHDAPADYYRFSRFCMHDVLLANLEERQVFTAMSPPRIIGLGRKADHPGSP